MSTDKDASSLITEGVKCALIPGYSWYKIWDSVSNTENCTTDELTESAKKAELESFILQAKAKAEQELSIARRIMCANEVEIEEYYDINGKGNAGLNVDESSFTFGVSGEGRKVTKRVIKFKGFNEKYIQEIKTEFDKTDKTDKTDRKLR